jgi:PAS domain S-box-containing protein
VTIKGSTPDPGPNSEKSLRAVPVPRRLRRAWRDAPIIVKGLLVVALPVLTLVTSSVLVLNADADRRQASRQREAAEAVDDAVGRVRTESRAAIAAATAYLTTPNDTTRATLERRRKLWDDAVMSAEAAALAEPDSSLRTQVHELRATSDELESLTNQIIGTRLNDPKAQPLFARAGAANTHFEDVIQAISDRASQRARAFADDYDDNAESASRLILASALLGALGATIAMLALAFALRRRVKALRANSEALGEGRELTHLGESGDELGRLGRGLEEAALVLRDREQALHDAAETLRANEQRLALALEAGSMGTFDVDLVTGVATWDAQVEIDHGLERGTFGGVLEAWLDRVHPDDRAAVMASGTDALSAGGEWSCEYRSPHPDGSVRWVGMNAQAIVGDSGTPVRLVGVAIDITERKEAEETLRAAIAEAERANSTKSEFLSRVSHELRTPLNAILGFGQLLELDELTGEQQESVGQVLRGGRHLLALIDDVLDISRIESGNLPLSMEATAVADVLSETLSLVAALAEQHGVTMRVEPTAPSGVHVLADRRRLKQVLVNLATNGVKYNEPGGRVTFTCSSPEPGVVRIAVRDTGNGIPADMLERLFTPFDRLGAEQTAVDGTGIGLALSQRLAEMMGTSLAVQTTVGDGTTFSLDLPVAADPADRAVPDGGGHDVTYDIDGPGGTVLYVEDNPSNLRLVQRLVERRGGIRLLSATTGATAIAMASRMPVDVVLLDLHLPDMSGMEVLRHLRADPATARTPIVVVSADATPGQLERLRAGGADGFLSKPIDLGAFMRELDSHLAGVVAS